VAGRVGVVCWKAKFRPFRVTEFCLFEVKRGQHAEVWHLQSWDCGQSGDWYCRLKPDQRFVFGASRRVHFILLPVWSRSGSCSKSRFMESAQDPQPIRCRALKLRMPLGNSHSREAVPLLISLLLDANSNVRRASVDSLTNLTHRSSTSGIDQQEAAGTAHDDWIRWWASEGATAKIYRIDDCSARILCSDLLREDGS
jgi:hypothetical protein